jgi:hypothetical protein
LAPNCWKNSLTATPVHRDALGLKVSVIPVAAGFIYLARRRLCCEASRGEIVIINSDFKFPLLQKRNPRMTPPNVTARPPQQGVWALQLNAADNVAVALEEIAAGTTVTIGRTPGGAVTANEVVPAGHKIALAPLASGDLVIKYGVAIGYATAAVDAGEWVHTHNCRSRLDERSHTLDPHSGATTDTPYV